MKFLLENTRNTNIETYAYIGKITAIEALDYTKDNGGEKIILYPYKNKGFQFIGEIKNGIWYSNTIIGESVYVTKTIETEDILSLCIGGCWIVYDSLLIYPLFVDDDTEVMDVVFEVCTKDDINRLNKHFRKEKINNLKDL